MIVTWFRVWFKTPIPYVKIILLTPVFVFSRTSSLTGWTSMRRRWKFWRRRSTNSSTWCTFRWLSLYIKIWINYRYLFYEFLSSLHDWLFASWSPFIFGGLYAKFPSFWKCLQPFRDKVQLFKARNFFMFAFFLGGHIWPSKDPNPDPLNQPTKAVTSPNTKHTIPFSTG